MRFYHDLHGVVIKYDYCYARDTLHSVCLSVCLSVSPIPSLFLTILNGLISTGFPLTE